VLKAVAMLGAEFILASKRSYVSSYLSFLKSFYSLQCASERSFHWRCLWRCLPLLIIEAPVI